MHRQPTVNTAELEHALFDYLVSYPFAAPELLEIAEYVLRSPGHRWRPILTLAVYERLTTVGSVHAVLPLACGIELLHTASLLLDDLPAMDDAKLRRGKLACHRRFTEAHAILAAHWLCDVADHCICKASLAREVVLDLAGRFKATRTDMIRGQLRDLSGGMSDWEKVIDCYRLKSGSLYSFSAASPAMLLGLSAQSEDLTIFGSRLGIAYQISDDIYDVTGCSDELGKEVHQDEGKPTIPRLLGIPEARRLRDSYKADAIQKLKQVIGDATEIIDLVHEICGSS